MIREFLAGFGCLIEYYLVCAVCLLLVRRFFEVPTEIFRKALHFVLLCSLFVFLFSFQTWWVSAFAAVAFAAFVFPILAVGEKIKGFSELLTERKKGELKRSLIIVFGMFAVMICVCWGWLDDIWLLLACIFAWGFGDAAAALVGKRFGRHCLEGRLIEGRKSVEGTFAMFAVSFFTVAAILFVRGGLPWYGCVAIALFSAAGCAATELYTLGGFDTITCPFAAAAIIIPSLFFWNGLMI